MSMYTADDFKRAEFARHEGTGAKAVRHSTSVSWERPWTIVQAGRGDTQKSTDAILANFGWVPVQENGLTDDAIKSLVTKHERALVAKIRQAYADGGSPSALSIAAAVYVGLTEKPRPKTAVELADAMEDYSRDGLLEENGLDGLADHLAAMGYRKEQS